MNKLLTAWIATTLFSATTAFSQTEESRKTFREGMVFCSAGQYAKAIAAFKKCKELDSDQPEYKKEYADIWTAYCRYRQGDLALGEGSDVLDYNLMPVDRDLVSESDSLSDVASGEMRQNNLFSALSTLTKVIEKEEKILGKTHYYVGNSYSFRALVNYYLGRTVAADSDIDHSIDIFRSNEEYAGSFQYGLVLLRKVMYMIFRDDFDNALPYALKAKEVMEKWKHADAGNFIDLYYSLARIYSYQRNYDKTSENCKKLDDIITSLPDSVLAINPEPVCFDIKALREQGKLQEALALAERALKAADVKNQYAQLMFKENRYSVYMDLDMPEQAVADIKDVIGIYENDGQTNRNMLYHQYLELSRGYYAMKRVQEALASSIEAEKRYTASGDSDDYFAACLKNAQMNDYYALNKFGEALQCANEGLNRFETIQEKEGYAEYGALMWGKGNALVSLGRIAEAVEFYAPACRIMYNLGDYKNCKSCEVTLAKMYLYIGRMTDALSAMKRAFAAYDKYHDNRNNIEGAMLFIDEAQVLNSVGDNQNALQRYALVTEIFKYNKSEKNIDYARMLASKALVLMSQGKYADALDVELEALKLIGELKGLDSQEYNDMLVFCAQMTQKNGRTSEALQMVSKLDFSKPVEKWNVSLDGASAYLQLMIDTNHDEEALATSKALRSLVGKFAGEESMQYATLEINECGIYGKRRNWEKCYELMQSVAGKSMKIIRSNFLTMSSQERENLWNGISELFTLMIPTACSQAEKEPKFTSLAYNSMLMSKGLLLQTNNSISEMIESKGSNELKNLYNSFLSHKKMLSNFSEFNSINKNLQVRIQQAIRLDSLKETVDREEHDVAAMTVKELGDFTSFTEIKWNDVRDRLKDNEAAVEFIQYYNGIDRGVYGALVINGKSKNPVFVEIANVSQLDSLKTFDTEKLKLLSEKIWKPIIENVGKGISVIYFSPDGMMYNTPVESLPMWNTDRYVFDKYKLIRLSSTRELAIKRNDTGHDAAIYGGMKYDMTTGDMTDENMTYNKRISRSVSVPFVRGERESEDALNELPGTKKEAEEIFKYLSEGGQRNIKPNLYEGKAATEASLKAQSGCDIGILHIGTHGFYDASDGSDNVFYKNINVSQHLTAEDKALLKSGLYFSGAQNVINGMEIPDGVDDGVLTAQEIAYLDFRKVGLVTLSACQTGLGDVSQEGVYGLQRGFKKAGAGTILMSLWKVDDEATSMLMTEFYRLWNEGRNKYEALEKAKEKVRNTKGFENFKYWAAFIMLDGIDN